MPSRLQLAPTSLHPSPGRTALPALLTILLLLLLLLVAPSPLGTPAHAVPPGAVLVDDSTGTVDEQSLAEDLARVDFRTEVDLMVLVLDVTEHGRSAGQDTALNDAVRGIAEGDRPELLSEDGQHYADGTVILALDPENRFLGTYAGEDVKLSDSGFEAVQEAMREDARSGQWDAALQAGAEEYAELLDRPWWQSTAALVAGLVVLVGALTAVLSTLGLRSAARRRVDRTLPRYQDVLATRAVTDSSARTLPESSPYARAVLQAHEVFGRRIAEAQQLHEQLPAPSLRPWSWGLRSAQRMLSRDFADTVGYLDDTDDSIIAAADLLHRIGDWRSAWERELQPLRDSVTEVEELELDESEMGEEERRAAAELTDLCESLPAEFDELTTQLEQDRIDPDSALERLDTLTRELSAAVSRLQGQRIASVAQDEDEAEVMRESGFDMRNEEDDYRSLRARRHRLEHGNDASAIWHLSPVLWYSAWHHDSTSELESHRNPSSSSSSGSSFSGYSGGGFSGAGSSSRF